KLAHGEPTPTREFIPEVAEALGAPKPLHIPAWLGRLLAGDVAVTMMTEGRGSSKPKAKRGLRWEAVWAGRAVGGVVGRNRGRLVFPAARVLTAHAHLLPAGGELPRREHHQQLPVVRPDVLDLPRDPQRRGDGRRRWRLHAPDGGLGPVLRDVRRPS